MFPNLLKMVQVECLKLLRIRLWGCMIGLLVPPNRAHAPQPLSGPGTASAEPKPFKPIELEHAFGGAYRKTQDRC